MTTQQIDPALLAKARDALSRARGDFRGRAPYWYSTLCTLIVHWVPRFGTFGVTDRGQLVVDPAAVVEWEDKWGQDVIAGVLAHEVLHVVLQHVLRRGNRDPRRWNIAADLYINGLLVDAGWKLPPCGVFPMQFRDRDGKTFPHGLTADEYYDLLDGSQNEQGQDGASEGNGEEGPCSGSCGTGAGGEKLDGEPAPGDVDEDGEQILGRSEGELRGIAEQAARATAEAAAKGVGNVPSSLRRWADQTLQPPKVQWHQILKRAGQHAINRAGRGKRTYSRPNRRQACMGGHPRTPVLASRRATQCDVWFAVDTSGSMGANTELRRAASELDGVLKRKAGRMSVLACDVRVQGKPKHVTSIQEVLPMLAGGGGTDFRPIFREYDETPAKERPKLIVVATDGCGPAPAAAPKGVEVIWLLVGRHRKQPCSWGEVIEVD
jgi:predicted metal-dependent peptidase